LLAARYPHCLFQMAGRFRGKSNAEKCGCWKVAGPYVCGEYTTLPLPNATLPTSIGNAAADCRFSPQNEAIETS